MPRERLHRKLLLSYLVLIAVFIAVALWAVPLTSQNVQGVAGAGVAAALVGFAFASLASRSVGDPLSDLARGLRALATGEPVRAADIRREAAHDELDDVVAAFGQLARDLGAERQRLLAENARLRTVLDGMSEGVALLADGRIAFANPAFTRLLEVKGNIDGLTLLEAVRRYDLAESIAGASGGPSEARDLQTPTGRILQIHAAPLQQGAAVVVALDVTEARSLERLRREFVANASHELRTPVAAIQAVAETLAATPDMAASDRARFERILTNHAARLSRLVKDLLDLSRAEASRPRVEPVDLMGPLASARQAVASKAEARRIRIDEDVPPGLPPLSADATAVEQVLVNLLDNAVKYTPEGGRVTVRAALESGPGDRAPSRMIRIDVADTGIGIPAEHLPRIFERFYRVDPARSRDMGGTGLGLSIVKHLVQSHGGDVRVESRVGAGSTFHVTFPVVATESAA